MRLREDKQVYLVVKASVSCCPYGRRDGRGSRRSKASSQDQAPISLWWDPWLHLRWGQPLGSYIRSPWFSCKSVWFLMFRKVVYRLSWHTESHRRTRYPLQMNGPISIPTLLARYNSVFHRLCAASRLWTRVWRLDQNHPSWLASCQWGIDYLTSSHDGWPYANAYTW